ncbi:MAG TPA: hypothetical protein VH593_11485 [Ktedonobacteraceae bacterium]|jgi:hypothetical protein
MYHTLLKAYQQLHRVAGPICLLTLLLTACSGYGHTAETQTSASRTTGTSQATATNSANNFSSTLPTDRPIEAAIAPGVQPCPNMVSTPTYWNAVIPVQAGVQQVNSITCAYLEGIHRLQALVTVRTSGTGGYLDAYVYDNFTSHAPGRIFLVRGLSKGQAKISPYSTVLTSEVDPNSSVNKGQGNAALQNDLNREFKWSASTHSFVQVAFPGIYPHTTRYQAERAQQANLGSASWEKDARQVATHFGTALLKWNSTKATIVHGGGPGDPSAIIDIQNATGPSTKAITLTMSRLEGNIPNGIWEIISVTSSDMSLNTPAARSIVHTPLMVTGSGTAFEGVIGAVTVLDHLYSEIGRSQARGAQGNGLTTFATSVSYSTTFKGGEEEGILALISYSQANGAINGMVMQKEIL